MPVESWHVSAELLRRFIGRTVTGQEAMHLVRHLLRGCHQCSELTQRILGEQGYWGFLQRAAGFPAEAYDDAFAVAIRFATKERRRIAESRLVGWAQWASIESLLPEERLSQVKHDRQYHHWGLYKALLDASLWYSRTDPREAVNIVSLAITVAELLDPATAGGERAATDLQAAAWAFFGNARRLASDLDGARDAINEAWRLNEHGTGDPLEKARIISIDASWARTMGEFEVAEDILGEALTIYIGAHDYHMQGRALLQMGNAIGYLFPERGIDHIRHALELINATREPRLALCAQHDLAWFLNDAGRSEEALAVFDRARPLYKQFQDDWTQIRFHWIQGKIARGMGRLDEAARILQQVWDACRDRTLNYDLLMVSIDRAEAMAANHEYESAARLVADVHRVMIGWNLHRHALAAWLVFHDAIEHRRVDTLAAKIRQYYLEHWNRPAEFSTAAEP